MALRHDPPDVCPRCGARDAYRPRYTTGGGWRIAYYGCGRCGRRHRVGGDR